MVLHGQGLDEALRTGTAQVRSFLIDMNTLFERFLERVIRIGLSDDNVTVEAQRSDSIFWRPDAQTRYARVRPDLLIQRAERPHARLPVDAKYKRYDDRRVDVGDLTQAFLYAYAYRDPEATGPPRAILVHPSETPGAPRVIPLQVRSVAERTVDADVAVVSVHIPTFLEAAGCGGDSCLDDLRGLIVEMLPPSSVGSAHLEVGPMPAA
jgi:5-methylcytosine-specific restriction enzyme subunit McrC